MHQPLSTSLFLVVALFFLVAPARAQTDAERCANKKPTIGEYRNLHHGFSIIIPAGLKGYWNSLGCDSAAGDCICNTDEGRRIPLGTDATVEVFAFYDHMDFEFFPPNASHNEIKALRREKHVNKVKLLRSGWVPLGDIEAYRFIIQFRRNKKSFIDDRILVIYERVVYELSLHTLADRYETDKKLFDEIIASWRRTQRIE